MDTISVRLTTNITNDGLQVPKTPVAVPRNFARFGLSEVVNHLLNRKGPDAIIWDFLVDGKLLRSSVGRCLDQKGLSAEKIVTIEYFEAQREPKVDDSLPHPDWVSSIDAAGSLLVTGCYDGCVRIWNGSTCLSSIAAHDSAITSVKTIQRQSVDQGSVMLISGSKDNTARLFRYSTESKKAENIYVCEHSDSVECVAVSPSSSKPQFVTGSWDHQILAWNPWQSTGTFDSTDSSEQDTSSKRRRVNREEDTQKMSDDDKDVDMNLGEVVEDPETKISELSPVTSFVGHLQCVSGVVWPSASAIYSGSWDHTVRYWDAPTAKNVTSWQTGSTISCVDFSCEHNLAATAHSDNSVRLWDVRIKDGSSRNTPVLILKSTNWCTSVSWGPIYEHGGGMKNVHLLSSCDHSGNLKIWDIRTKVPLHTLKGHDGKALCISWIGDSMNDDKIYSGGCDNKIVCHSIK